MRIPLSRILSCLLAVLVIGCAPKPMGSGTVELGGGTGTNPAYFEFRTGSEEHLKENGGWVVNIAYPESCTIYHYLKGDVTEFGSVTLLSREEQAKIWGLIDAVQDFCMKPDSPGGNEEGNSPLLKVRASDGTTFDTELIVDDTSCLSHIELIDYLEVIIESHTGVVPEF